MKIGVTNNNDKPMSKEQKRIGVIKGIQAKHA